jgi:hypothetical protein
LFLLSCLSISVSSGLHNCHCLYFPCPSCNLSYWFIWFQNSRLLFVVYPSTNIGSITITRSAIIFYCTQIKRRSVIA